MTKSSTKKRITRSVILIIILSICLCVTSFALVLAMLEEKNNIFQTGAVDIDLNNNEPVITEHEFLFEPGMTVVKPFYIKSNSTWDVYYKLYLENARGDLADVLEITIKDGEKVLASGTALELTREKVGAAEEILGVGERKNLTMTFHYPEDGDNSGQNKYLSFDLHADAVQTKNNPNKEFE